MKQKGEGMSDVKRGEIFRVIADMLEPLDEMDRQCIIGAIHAFYCGDGIVLRKREEVKDGE